MVPEEKMVWRRSLTGKGSTCPLSIIVEPRKRRGNSFAFQGCGTVIGSWMEWDNVPAVPPIVRM